MSSFAHLNDAELRQELMKMGMSVGPITAGTRSVYEKKLEKLQKDAKKSPAKAVAAKATVAATNATTKQSARKTVARRSTRARAGASEAEISDSEEPPQPIPPPQRVAPPPQRVAPPPQRVVPPPQRVEPPPQPRRQSSAKSNVSVSSPIVPGRANISVSSIRAPESPPSPRRRPLASSIASGVNVSPSRSIYSRTTVLDRDDTPPGRDPFAYSSAEDSDYHYDQPARSVVNKSMNTSFQPRSRRSYLSSTTATSDNGRPNVIVPTARGQPSSFQSMLTGLNKFRQDTFAALRRRLSWDGKRQKSPELMFGSEPGHYSIRDGRDTMRIDKQPSGEWRFRGSNSERHSSLRLDDGFPRVLLILLGVFLVVLGCAYIASAHRDQVKHSWTIVKDAAKDTANFFVRYAIIPTIVVGLCTLAVVGCYMLQRYRRAQAAAEKKNMFDMVDQIIDILRESARTATNVRDACVAVPHVRDMLIRAVDRKAKADLWESAVAYINENESRVSTETKFVNGQECLVWRWLPNEDKDDPAWQGSAFSDAQASLNAPREPYSECLKLRGMFDLSQQRGLDWPDFIQDALLEKLGPGIRVLHVAVDKTSKEGVVFMKLKSKREAEDAYKALHGSWFDGRIVSVKYLRSERYHQRFPDAIVAAYPLQYKLTYGVKGDDESHYCRCRLGGGNGSDQPPADATEEAEGAVKWRRHLSLFMGIIGGEVGPALEPLITY
uniref:LEM domain-containing protein n=1 Tax=Plectus sambesii TaxID=2011161 RepID=A0A914WVM2_9BILA